MELKSCEKETSSLVMLYQELYHARLRDYPATAVASQADNKTDDGGSDAFLLASNLPPLDHNKHSNDDDDDTSNSNTTTKTDMTVGEARDSVVSFRERVTALGPKMDRFQKRLQETDPVTGTSRYGEKTAQRVRAVLDSYEILNATATDATIADTLDLLQRTQRGLEEEEARRNERVRQEQQQEQQQQRELTVVRQREREQQAQAAVALRLDQARLARTRERERVRRADREWVTAVHPRGPEGVTKQLEILVSNSTGNDDHDDDVRTALTSLRTMFAQIVARPETESFRTIRRNHPRFQRDIGRHRGGCELLIAAGFRLRREHDVVVDDLPESEQTVFLESHEPNLETDMDGWSAWFDGLKETLRLIENKVKELKKKR